MSVSKGKPSQSQKQQATDGAANYYDREVSLTFTLREIGLVQNAVSDEWVRMSKEVKRRKAAKETYERLEDNTNALELINSDLKAILARGR